MIETALDEEMEGSRASNARSGKTGETVLTDVVGPVDIQVPRDRQGTFWPVIVRKRQRRLNDVDESVSFSARERTDHWGDSHAFPRYSRASVSKEMVNRITDRVMEEMHEWETL